MDIRNIAIIAHVDHGKTTLVDCCCASPAPFATTSRSPSGPWTRNDLERERGITILAKCTSVLWKGTRDQHRRHPRPRRFRRRGRAYPEHGRRRRACWSMRPKARCPRPSSCSARRCKLGLRPIVRDQQGRPPRRPRRTKSTTTCSTCSPSLEADRRAARLPDPVRVRPQRLGGGQPGSRTQRHDAAVRPDPPARAAAEGRRRQGRRPSRCW